MKNWFGWESHPSDILIHWSEVRWDNGKRLNKEVQKHIEAVRAAWDLIHATKELSTAFELLYQCARDVADANRADDEAGEDL